VTKFKTQESMQSRPATPSIARGLQAVVCFLALTLGLFLGTSHAQVATGTISGQVQDAQGAVVPGANIKLTNIETANVTPAASDAGGEFTFRSVPAGRYNLLVEANGFTSYTVQNLILNVNQALRVPVKLTIGAVNVSVTVEADAIAVDSQTASVQSVVTESQVSNLPLNARDASKLVLDVPGVGNPNEGGAMTIGAPSGGVSNGSEQALSASFNYPGSTALTVNGTRVGGTYFALDGANNTNPLQVTGGPFPNPDATGEFSVQTAGYGARYVSAPGGAVNIITRSGTNHIHGVAFEYLRNGFFNAVQQYPNSGTAAVPDNLHRHQFGGTVGGPILKDRLFIFGSYQRTNITNSAVTPALVPTDAMRAGIVPGVVCAYYAFFCPLGYGLNLPYDAATNTTDISAYLSPVNQKLLNYIPHSNDSIGNYHIVEPSKGAESQYVGKVDYDLGAQKIFLRYFGDFNHTDPIGNAAVSILGTFGSYDYDWQNAAFGHTWIHGNLVNEFRFSAMLFKIVNQAVLNAPSIAALGANVTPAAIPGLDASATGAFTGYTGPYNDAPSKNFDMADNLSVVKGKHAMSFGFEAQYVHVRQYSQVAQNPLAFYLAAWSSDARIDFLLGKPYVFVQEDGQYVNLSGHLFGAHAEDAWRLTPRTTLTAGLRWDPYFPAYSTTNGVNCYNQGQKSTIYSNAPAGMIFPGDPGCNASGSVGNTITNVQPRIALARQLDKSGKTSIRAAYGLYTMQVPVYALFPFDIASPFMRSYEILGSIHIENPWANEPGGDPFVGGFHNPGYMPASNATFPSTPTISAMDSSFRSPYVQQYTASAQRALTSKDIIEVAYVATAGRHLVMNYNPNRPVYNPSLSLAANVASEQARRPDQNFTSIYVVHTNGDSRYNGASVTLRHTTKSLYVSSGLTWSRSRDDNSLPGNAQYSSEPEAAHDFTYAKSDFDQPLTWRTTVVWNTPKLESWNHLARTALGEWNANGIYSMESGSPFSALCSADISATGAGLWASVVPGVSPHLAHPTSQEWFNTAAFSCTATTSGGYVVPGSWGNAGRNSLRSSHYINADAGLSRIFPIHDAVNLTFRAEAFNLFNHTNLLMPANDENAPKFGVITYAGPPRVMQFALRLAF